MEAKMEKNPVIAITMGDAAGIGPEVIARSLENRPPGACRWLIIGDAGVMRRAGRLTGCPADWKIISCFDDMPDDPAEVALLDMHNIPENDAAVGCVNAICGQASVDYILEAARLALNGKIKALVTAPINKEATRLAGLGELGHLELLASYTHSKDYATMLVSENLRVVHLTTHYSLSEAVSKVKQDLILARLGLIDRSFRNWGFQQPVIGVAALNPHGGEGGLVGREEIEEIIPAVAAARHNGIDARGPYPADTIFNRALKGELDVVLALYHDQGHIAIKVHNVEKSISIALGLPFIRTSVDHGTAYDIAWQGKADSTSMQEAMRAAVNLVEKKTWQPEGLR